jgi:GDP-4-dehydro-6-deoxy-D-mannose reductase
LRKTSAACVRWWRFDGLFSADPSGVMRVLVTGANGFVGRHLRAALEARGHDVVAAEHSEQGGDVLPLDLRDALNVRGVVDIARADAVAHLAAQTFIPASIADPWSTHDVNAGGTLRLLEALRAARAGGGTDPRILVAGSADVYGVQGAFPVVETAPLHPANPYAASKIAAESYGVAAAAAYQMNVVVTRAFNHIGRGQDRRFVVPSFALQLASIANGGDPLLRVGNLDAERDFLDVRDVVAAYVLLLEGGGAAGEVYNVAGGRAVSIKDILRQLVMIARVGVEIRDDPERLRPSDVPRLVGDAGKLRAATGWEPAIGLPAALRDVYADARERVAAAGHANSTAR